MKDKQLQEWSYWIGIASQAERGLLASSNFLETGVLINNKIKQELKDFLKSCEAGRKLQSSLEETLAKITNPREMEERFVGIKNYQDVFSEIIKIHPEIFPEIYTYLNATDGLEKGDRGSAKLLRDFYSRMLNLSSKRMYECSQNI